MKLFLQKATPCSAIHGDHRRKDAAYHHVLHLPSLSHIHEVTFAPDDPNFIVGIAGLILNARGSRAAFFEDSRCSFFVTFVEIIKNYDAKSYFSFQKIPGCCFKLIVFRTLFSFLPQAADLDDV